MRPAALVILLAAGTLAGCNTDPAALLAGPPASQTAGAEPAAAPAAAADAEAADAATTDAYLAAQSADVQAALAALPAPTPGTVTAPGARPAPPAPRIYMALEDGKSGQPLSVIFAIDAARDGNPSDDRALRVTPDDGKCNPQDMTRFSFPDGYAAPVFSEAEQAAGVTATDLPGFLAATVTQTMLARGLAQTEEDTRPQNVCTRKLWERLVLAENL